jgi:hypothetical protein
MTIDVEELEQHLRELPISTPDPASVTAYVLAAQPRVETAPVRRPFNSWILRPVAAGLAGLLFMWAVLYFSPAAGAALAGAPGVGPFSSMVLNEVGLGAGSTVTAEDAAAAHSGVTVRLVGATASPLRTVLLVKVSPAYSTLAGMTLSDQFGFSYYPQGGYGDLRTGDWALVFAPPSCAAAALGMRFTLTLDGVYTSTGQIYPLAGSWKLAGTVLSNAGQTVAAPQSTSLSGGTISFASGTEADGVLEMTAHVRGLPIPQIPSTKQTGPSDPVLAVDVTDSSGAQLNAWGDARSEDGGWAIDIVAYGLADHGSYTITITIPGSGVIASAITI